MPSRRGLLASAGALAAGTGCTGLNPLAEREPLPRLGRISLSNSDDVAHELTVRIDRDGERVFAETFELATDGEEGTFGGVAEVECGPGAERGRYTVSFETGAEESAETEYGRGHGPTRSVLADIRAEGKIAIFSGANDWGSLCDSPTPTPE